MDRENIFKRVSTIVVKIGTAMLTDEYTNKLSQKRIKNLVEQIVSLKKNGYKVLLVSSGAVASGAEILFDSEKPSSIPKKQAAASVGQIRLMNEYSKLFKKNKMNIGQVLLSDFVLRDRLSYLNAKNTLRELLDLDIIPIINENDTITTDELQFGDNDFLSATVSTLVEADLLILLTDVDGVYQNFKDEHSRTKYDVIDKIDDIIRYEVCGSGSKFSKGGMATKITAMEVAMSTGIIGIIASGQESDIISKIVLGQNVGTLFFTGNKEISQRKKWLAANLSHTNKGIIVIDDGAVAALTIKNKSLLATGIISTSGDYQRGDSILIISKDNRHVARGLSNYSSDTVNKVKGFSTKDISSMIDVSYDEVVHKDNIVILPN